jgi:dipeptidyl aminopeptidase/acylaminoacyl peptidase
VLQVNYRGSGGYGEDFMRAGYREWGGKMQDDVTDATKWAIAQGIAAADKVCIFGTGYGGYAAIMGTVREPKLYRCAAAYDGLFDLELLLGHDDPLVTPAARAYLDLVLGNDVKALRKRSPVANADKIETPILILAGGDPKRIEYQHANRLETALKDAGKPVDTALVQFREGAYKRLLEFLSEHLRSQEHAERTGDSQAAR